MLLGSLQGTKKSLKGQKKICCLPLIDQWVEQSKAKQRCNVVNRLLQQKKLVGDKKFSKKNLQGFQKKLKAFFTQFHSLIQDLIGQIVLLFFYYIDDYKSSKL